MTYPRASRIHFRQPESRQPSVWARTRLHFPLDDLQSEILDTPAPNVILCCSRQWGKTTITALRALHFALHNPKSTTVIAARSQRQSKLLLYRVRQFARELMLPLKRDPRDPASLLLPNASALFALPCREATTRGFDAVGFLILDEAARVPDSVYVALRPMRATTGGLLWLLSTPRGESGFFAEAWRAAESRPGWARFSVPATSCPRIQPDFLAAERLDLGAHRFAEEYLCHFLPSPTQIIPAYVLEPAITPAEQPLELLEDLPCF